LQQTWSVDPPRRASEAAPIAVRAADPDERPAPARTLPRVLQPDAVRAGQIAGQLAEVRYRLVQANVGCADQLEPLAAAFADARAHPDRADWETLGAELDVTLREGSRTATRLRGALGGTSASLLGEGPFGASARGSWLVTVRRSYVDWPVRQIGREMPNGSAFGFSDVQAKVTYDLRPTQQVSAALIGGRSTLVDWDDRTLATSRSTLATVAWRSTWGPRFVLQQRGSMVARAFGGQAPSVEDRAHGTDVDVAYRSDLVGHVFGGVLDMGSRVERARATRWFPSSTLAGDEGDDEAARETTLSVAFEDVRFR